MKKLAILGSTGSIGKSTLKIVQHLPKLFEVTALAAHSNISLLTEQILIFKPKIVSIFDENKALELRKTFPHLEILHGQEGLNALAQHNDVDFVVMAIVGLQALRPTLAALQAKKEIALASKEVLVAAGELVQKIAARQNIQILPIDSEHSAIFQCIQGKKSKEIARIILTASGGPFRSHSKESLEKVTAEEALKHPTWAMGPKVTIDCSNLMNKGLEMIEARWLFDIPPEKIEMVIHPQSIVHSFVEWVDGSMMAQMSEPNMIYPIQYALTYPTREHSMFPLFDFLKNGKLEFYPPSFDQFPALTLAMEGLTKGGTFPCALNGANEVLVERFLKGEISWLGIVKKLEKLLGNHKTIPLETMETVFAVDEEARGIAATI